MENRLHVVIHVPEIKNVRLKVMTTIIANHQFADSFILIPDYAKESRGISRAIPDTILECFKEAKHVLPVVKIGVNFLGEIPLTPELLTAHNFDIVQNDGLVCVGLARTFPKIEFFGGLAFKYSKHETARGDALRELCRTFEGCAKNLIPTTSGVATGESADLSKIEEIRTYLPSGRLAIASGITIENVGSYTERGVTDFVVATSLIDGVTQDGFDLLSTKKVKELYQKIKSG